MLTKYRNYLYLIAVALIAFLIWWNPTPFTIAKKSCPVQAAVVFDTTAKKFYLVLAIGNKSGKTEAKDGAMLSGFVTSDMLK